MNRDLFQRLRELETFSTPLEFLSVWDAATHKRDNAFLTTLESSETMAVLRRDQVLSQLRCEADTKYARLLATPDTKRENLLIVFTGAAMRPMMPLPIFIQALPANTDLLVLYDPWRDHFRRNILNGELSLYDLPRALRHWVARYESAISIGTSSGGLPALRYARLANLAKGFAFGGAPIDDTMRCLRGDVPHPAFDPLCNCTFAGETDLVLVFGEKNVRDAKTAKNLEFVKRTHLVPLWNIREHGILWVFHKLGVLNQVLDLLMNGTTECFIKFIECSEYFAQGVSGKNFSKL